MGDVLFESIEPWWSWMITRFMGYPFALSGLLVTTMLGGLTPLLEALWALWLVAIVVMCVIGYRKARQGGVVRLRVGVGFVEYRGGNGSAFERVRRVGAREVERVEWNRVGSVEIRLKDDRVVRVALPPGRAREAARAALFAFVKRSRSAA